MNSTYAINLQKVIKTYLPQCTRQSFYKSLIQPIIDYACVIWGATSQYNLDRIIRLYQYAARVILNIKRPQDVPSSELFYKLNRMTINQRIEYFTSILMFKSRKWKPVHTQAILQDWTKIFPVQRSTRLEQFVCGR